MAFFSSTTLVAKQFLPVEGIVNARDLGGYEGFQVKKGQLLRAAHLANATSRDLAYLEMLGVATVIDFRKQDEKTGHYDKAVPGATYVDLPIDASGRVGAEITDEEKKTYVGKKMDKNVATALNSAIAAAENVGDTRDAVNTASANLSSAVTDATASIDLYKKVAEYIAKVDALGEAAKASFADVQKAYNDGTITSLADVEAAYAEAVKAQEEANGIGDVTVDAKSQQIYTADGKATNTLGHGINIVKEANGKVTKVIKK